MAYFIYLHDINVIYCVLIIGILGLFIEAVKPGLFLPGICGSLCLGVALLSFSAFPINYLGLTLLLLGSFLLMLELFFIASGVLSVTGIICFLIGSIVLTNLTTPPNIALPLLITLTILSTSFFFLLHYFSLSIRHKPTALKKNVLIGQTATIISIKAENQCWTKLHGDLWEVKSDKRLKIGSKIQVIRIEENILIGSLLS